MVDAHCHLVDNHFGEDQIGVIINRAREAGVKIIISNGTSIENTRKTIEIAEKYPEVWATVGVHPDEVTNSDLPKLSELVNLTKHPKVMAVGEAALDFYEGVDDKTKEMQRMLFELHIQLATETNLPMVVHNRNADDEVLEHLRDFKGGVQLHCFVENREYAQEAIKRGWYLSFGGIVTFKKSEYLRDILKEIPEENLLTETDAPFLAPEPLRGTVNVPANVKIVAERIAGIRDTSINRIEEVTEINTRKLFNIK